MDRLLLISRAPSSKSTIWQPQKIMWSEFSKSLAAPIRSEETQEAYQAMTKEERSKVKDVGGFVGGTFRGKHRHKDQMQGRDLITLDMDALPQDAPEKVLVKLRAYGYTYAVYSTRSHTPEAPRIRVILPLDQTVSPDEYEPIARRLGEMLGMDWCDRTTFQPERMMYWPSASADAEYHFEASGGDLLSASTMLSTYDDWHDVSSWPYPSSQREAPRKQAGTLKDPKTKAGWIGAWCRVYDVYEVIKQHLATVYSLDTDDRYTYLAGSGTRGGIIYEGGLFGYSCHGTDPACEQTCNSFDLVRIHKFGDLDKDKSLPMSLRPSYEAMKAYCAQDPKVAAEFEAGRLKEFQADFAQREEDEYYLPDMDYTKLPRPQGETDVDYARAFCDWAGGKIRYQASLEWLFFDGVCWREGQEQMCMRLLITYVDAIQSIAKLEMDKEPGNKYLKSVYVSSTKAKSAGRITSILKLSQSLVLVGSPEEFDSSPELLNTLNGIVDLRTGDLRPHDPYLLMTKATSCAADKHALHPLWDDLLQKACQSDTALIKYLQLAAGMALFGAVYEEGMLLSVGPGSNGKSTIFGAWLAILGSYGKPIRQEILMESRGFETVGMADVRGRRLVVVGETKDGSSIDISVLKRLTSRDAISAKALYANPFSFIPTHTLVMHTNFLPRLKTLDGGTRRRIAVVPLEHKFEGADVVTDYNKQLETEHPAILWWMIQGAKAFWSAGKKLAKPAVVLEATAEYFDNEDWMATFLEDSCDIGEDNTAGAKEIYQTYTTWCFEQGIKYPLQMKYFTQALESRGFQKKRMTKAIMWLGLSISCSL